MLNQLVLNAWIFSESPGKKNETPTEWLCIKVHLRKKREGRHTIPQKRHIVMTVSTLPIEMVKEHDLASLLVS